MKNIKKYISLFPVLFLIPVSLSFVGNSLFGSKDFDLDIEVIDLKINRINTYSIEDYTYHIDKEELEYLYDDGMKITYSNINKEDFINIYSVLLAQGLESAVEASLDSSRSINENRIEMMKIENRINELRLKNRINRMKLEDNLNYELLKKL